MKKPIRFIARLTCALLLSASVQADVAIITHPDNANTPKQDEVRRIFLGKTKTFNNGQKAVPADLTDSSQARTTFLKKVLRKSESSLNSYWARMLFSSKGKPPRQFNDATAVQVWVSKTPGAIAYIDAKDLDPAVRVIEVIKE